MDECGSRTTVSRPCPCPKRRYEAAQGHFTLAGQGIAGSLPSPRGRGAGGEGLMSRNFAAGCADTHPSLTPNPSPGGRGAFSHSSVKRPQRGGRMRRDGDGTKWTRSPTRAGERPDVAGVRAPRPAASLRPSRARGIRRMASDRHPNQCIHTGPRPRRCRTGPARPGPPLDCPDGEPDAAHDAPPPAPHRSGGLVRVESAPQARPAPGPWSTATPVCGAFDSG